MTRAVIVAGLLLAAPAAAASGWVPCEQQGIVPPEPIRRDAPAYPPAVRELGIEGVVEVALTVLRDGSVGWVLVIRAEPRGYFEQAASESVRNWRFAPATQDGAPIECRLRTRVRFALTDSAATAAAGAEAGRPQPVYPPALLQARVEGYAEVEYTLDAEGAVRDARLLVAMPRGEFESAALAAVRGWRGPPAPGVPERIETRRFDFRLPGTWLDAVPATLLASAPFPMAACESGTTGRVVLEVETEATGQVREARILSAEPAGLFDGAALEIARGSRLTPAYRDGMPVPATALLALRFDPAKATCPNRPERDRDAPASKRPQPRVTYTAPHDEPQDLRAERWAALPRTRRQPLP
ncbi:MAG TPA: energy transducer TonB [Steroidobacteraceae bacterium]|nr:energy transducer TonB [Steroidobacteraceae bacterium]